MISMIAAVAENRVIGNKNGLPWHLPADFKYFKEATLNKTIVMGLNTFKSIGEKPLPSRKNIILNNDLKYKVPEGCFVAKSIEELLEIIKDPPGLGEAGEQEVFICGGAFVYKQFLPLAQRLYLTQIHHSFEGDTYFPEYDLEKWKEIKRVDCKADEENKYDYSFIILKRKEHGI